MTLTAKQEAFAIKFVECGIASDAYRANYSTSNMKDETVWNNSYMLLNRSEVKARVRELRDKIADKLVIDKQYVTDGIIRNITGAEEDKERATALKGYDMLAKMYDLNEDKQNDRVIRQKDREALLENFKQRLVDVTPEEEECK